MIDKELIDRINALAHKSKTEGLTPEEKQEQQALRQRYLKAIRAQVKASLDALTGRAPDHENCSCDHCSCEECNDESDGNDQSNCHSH